MAAALALSVLALALPRGAPAAAVAAALALGAAAEARWSSCDVARALALQLGAALIFRGALVGATLLHEVRALRLCGASALAFAFFALGALLLVALRSSALKRPRFAQWSHIAFGALVGQRQLLSAANLRGGLSGAVWLHALRPFSGGASLAPRVVPRKPAGRAADALTAAAGLAFSVALALAASAWADRSEAGGASVPRTAAAVGAWVCALGAAASDGADVAALLRGGAGLQARPAAAEQRSESVRTAADSRSAAMRQRRPSAAATSACCSPPQQQAAPTPWQSWRRASPAA